MKALFLDFLSLFFPELCPGCRSVLVNGEKIICTHCLYHLPRQLHDFSDHNPIVKLFWGKIPLEAAGAFLVFSKMGRVQKLLHAFKYQSQKNIGRRLGDLFGESLQKNACHLAIDCLIPVPLHPEKEKKRGFNQSEILACAMAEKMNLPVITDAIGRCINTPSQTNKSKYERWENTRNAFVVIKPHKLTGKHILLVDDILTTGSTLEALAQAIKPIEGTSISITAIAWS